MKKLIPALAVVALLASAPAAEAKVGLVHKVVYQTVHWAVLKPAQVFTDVANTALTSVGKALSDLDAALAYSNQ